MIYYILYGKELEVMEALRKNGFESNGDCNRK